MIRPWVRPILAALLATGSVSAIVSAQADTYDRAVELASFDTAWTRVRDSYYDASMRDNWRPA
jgi:hypothetical protein